MVIYNAAEALESGGDPSTTVALQQLAVADVAAPAAPELAIDALKARLPGVREADRALTRDDRTRFRSSEFPPSSRPLMF